MCEKGNIWVSIFEASNLVVVSKAAPGNKGYKFEGVTHRK